jgi:hypothetical protein
MLTTAAALPLTTASSRQSTRSTCECHKNRIPSARAARNAGGAESRGGRATDRRRVSTSTPLTANETASTENGNDAAATNSRPPSGGPISELGTVRAACNHEFERAEQRGPGEVGDRHDAQPVPAVDESSPDQAEQQPGRVLGGLHQRDPGRVLGEPGGSNGIATNVSPSPAEMVDAVHSRQNGLLRPGRVTAPTVTRSC